MGIALCKWLAAATAICALTASSASGETSSVDAYGGQAAVLGKPSQHSDRSPAPQSGDGRLGQTTEGQSSLRVGGATGSGPTTGSGSSSGSSGGSSGAGGSSVPGGGSSSHAGTGAGGAGSVTTSATARAPTTERPPSRVADESASALPLSALDVLLILAGLLCLIATALLLRRLAHSPSSETSR